MNDPVLSGAAVGIIVSMFWIHGTLIRIAKALEKLSAGKRNG